MMMMTCEQIV